jgi:hypothetical protein
MGFQWRVDWILTRARQREHPGLIQGGARWDALLERAPSSELTLNDLGSLCQQLECQLGDLLIFTQETPEEQAEQVLTHNLLYQSFLAHQAQQAHEEKSAENGSDERPKT